MSLKDWLFPESLFWIPKGESPMDLVWYIPKFNAIHVDRENGGSIFQDARGEFHVRYLNEFSHLLCTTRVYLIGEL